MNSDRYIQKFIKKNVYGMPNQRVGVIVATCIDGQIRYGWSLAKVKPSARDFGTDIFDEERGIAIALERLNAKTPLEMPDTVRAVIPDKFVQYKKVITDENTGREKTIKAIKVIRGFETRAKKYFKLG